MTDMVQHAGLLIDPALYTFINQEALPETGLSSNIFWTRFAKVISDLSSENRALLAKRDRLQVQIDSFYRTNRAYSMDEYRTFLSGIGYLVDEPKDFSIETESVEPEISITAAPQLVVPVSNARFALNAANARFGSLYDALYGTDVLSESDGAERTSNYNPVRGFKVMAYARQFLDSVLPLASGSHIESTSYAIVGGELIVTLRDSVQVYLAEPAQFIGFQGSVNSPTALLFKHNGLHIEILFDPFHPIGAADKAAIKDVVLEAAATTIMDCEDSVAAVDAEDKIGVYRNWLGLMKGTLSETFVKQGQQVTRSLNVDKQYTSKAGERITLKGRSMMFVRNVGHLMTNCAIFDAEGEPVFEGIMDAMITSLCAMHDLQGNSPFKNSTAASINIVKPKMHGPEEVAFTNKLFAAIEDALELPRFTLKMGIMDEERRTSVNLKACIFEAKHRVVFINTGFLDRTGDEIHTSMLAGPVLPKARIKAEPWISAYEDRNVDIGLKCGFSGKAQIGKGMWPIPDKMAMMMEQKIAHPQSGANTAWVPSPTAATLHALHYHQVRVFELQDILKSRQQASLDALLTPPLLGTMSLSKEDIQAELDNNAQGILGYVVRWIDQGIGCSKVPDINHVGLMEDRATLRISSQHIANWLFHGICSKAQVESTFAKMARVVDGQNADDPLYQPMATSDEALANNLAYQAALALVFEGTKQPNGYTEPLLHQFRLQKKTH